jgi:hypothetical protein
MSLKRVMIAAAAVVAVCAAAADAGPLNRVFGAQNNINTALSGTTAAARPELAGTVLVDDIQGFSFGALNIDGTVQSRVVQETGSGTLDFYWRVVVDPASTGGGVSAFRLGWFGYDFLTDADYRTDGVGNAGPFEAALFNPAYYPEGFVNFAFNGQVQNSLFFFLHTNATSYARTAQFDLVGGSSGNNITGQYSTFAPDTTPVPEPASMLLLGSGLVGLATRARRKPRA